MDNGASSYRRYLDGDEQAFDHVVKEYFDSLVLFINRYVRDLDAAEDLAIDAFTYLVTNRHGYNFRYSLKTYLFTIGRSRALDYLKRRSRIAAVPLDEVGELEDPQPSPEQQLFAQEQKQALAQAMAQLDERSRTAVYLTYFQGFSAEEVARVLKKNRKQVYNLLYRAKNQLRTILTAGGEHIL